MSIEDLFEQQQQYVYEPPGGINVVIHLHGLISRPATTFISLPLTRDQFNATLRHARWRSITRTW